MDGDVEVEGVRSRGSSFAPWDVKQANRAFVILVLVGSSLMLLKAVTSHAPSSLGSVVAYALPLSYIGFAGVFVAVGDRFPPLFFTTQSVLGTALITLLDLVTDDQGTTAQLFLCFPVLYAASQLRPKGAYLVLAANVAAEGIIVFSSVSFRLALTDFIFSAVIFTSFATMLARGTAAQQQLTSILRHHATVDSLTGLVNRRVLDEAARSAIVAAAGSDAGAALILLDVDQFKVINDTYGHPVGDRTLAHIATVIAANTRTDSVISRIGGDEIAVLLPGCEYDIALRRAEQIVIAVHATPLLLTSGEVLVLSVSAGVAHAPTNGAELTALYAVADAGLYDAKRQGRNRVGVSIG
jgi:diguanylate cyclase (GGDEF)-like protein